ncbi:xylulokinase [Cellulomonas xiejunii]|uniref:FGGY family carbohydrate kinase n=1 Tax=Cellulomonas xiejunii TaxID=2968083 RepID=A0ABY5KSH3_9CELL|nr:FGGY family carbohydrate kinase [Cellulomonas xiejunii]MCC2321482.1 hypothetical protein [Cellulomonas xiejunii]MCC2323366.1 hypothetical protein [Cellulomonas xiejunii]UUI72055.1 FGGY family carbohydrate kinase [Cellulomonas xiejunii]
MRSIDAVLGIDLGTSVVKAGVYTADGVERAAGSCPVALRRLGGGHVEQDLDEFYAAAAAATRAALADSGFDPARIGAVAVAGQMAGVGLVDAAHRPLAPFDSWLDSRCGPVVDELAARHGERIAATSGCAPTLSIGPKMLWWQRTHPALCAKAASFVTAAGYVAGRAAGLAGREAFIDPSHLHFTAVADVGAGTWDDALVADLGLDPRLLPRITQSTDVVGVLTAEAADDFGLPPGVPVAAGCGDTAAGALGAGVTEPEHAFDVAGTAAVFGVCLPAFAPDTGGALLTMRAALPGRWYSLAYVGGAGQVLEWVGREVLGSATMDSGAYDGLAAVAATVPPGSDGVVLVPHFSGRIAPVAPATRGAVVGLGTEHHRGHLARAVLEAIAFEYRGYADAARASVPGLTLRSVTGSGGGSRSAVWNRIKANVLGVAYAPVRGIEAGTRGAAIVGLVSLGHDVPPLDASAVGEVELPDPADTAAYEAAYEGYRWWTERLVQGYRLRAEDISERRGGEDA